MTRNSSLGIAEVMYRQLEQTVKQTKTLAGAPTAETVAPPASNVPRTSDVRCRAARNARSPP